MFEDILGSGQKEISLDDPPMLICGYCVHYSTGRDMAKLGSGSCSLKAVDRTFVEKACEKYREVN